MGLLLNSRLRFSCLNRTWETAERGMGNCWMRQEQCAKVTRVTAPRGMAGLPCHMYFSFTRERYVRNDQTSQRIEGDLLVSRVLQGHSVWGACQYYQAAVCNSTSKYKFWVWMQRSGTTGGKKG